MLCTHDCKSPLCITMAWDVLSSVQCCIWTGELCSYLKLLDCDWNLCFSEEWRQASGLSLSQPQAFNFKDTDVSAVLVFPEVMIHYCQMLMNQTRRSGSRLHKLQIICADWSLNGKPTKFTCQRKSPPRQYRSPSLKKCSKCHCNNNIINLSVIHETPQESQVLMLLLVCPMCRA